MTMRRLEAVGGYIHDVGHLQSLDASDQHLICVSPQTLSIIQNYAISDATFTSRYGVNFVGDFYTPVSESDASWEFVLETIRNYRTEVIDMTCDIAGALNALTAVLSSSISNDCGCQIGTDVDTTDGTEGGPLPDRVNGVDYEAADPIIDRKCLAANYIHQAIRGVVNELKLNRADQYGFAGLQFVLTLVSTVVGGLILGPFGLLAGAVVGGFLAMATNLFKGSFSLTILLTAITSDEAGAVCSLFDATSASSARSAYTAHLLGEGATSVEVAFIENVLTNTVLNLLFFAWGDSEAAIDATTPEQDCSTCSTATFIHEFDFVSGNEQGWTNDAPNSRPFGIFSPGVGWVSVWGGPPVIDDERLYLNRVFADTALTQVDVHYTVTTGCGAGAEVTARTKEGGVQQSLVLEPYTCSPGKSFIQTLLAGAFVADEIETTCAGDAAAMGAHSQVVTKIVVSGNGVDPF